MSTLDRIRQILMSIIAAISGHGGVGGGGTGGGGGPVAPYLASITLSGPTQGVATYPTAAYTVLGFDQNGASFAFTPVFASGSTGVATINSSTGVATPISNGTTAITASAVNGNGQTIVSNAVNLVVSARAVTTVTITGPTTVVAGQQTAAYGVTAFDQNNVSMTGQTFVWSSSSTPTATIGSSSGIATGVAAGTTTIRATCAGVQSNGITLTVAARVVTSITISGPTAVIVTHATAAYSASAFDQAGVVMTGQTFVWHTSDATKGTATGGVVTGVAAGSTNITASIGAVTSNAVAVTVSAQVATGTIVLSPTSATIAAAGTQQFAGVVKDQGTPANVITGATITWDTADHAKATVSAGGLVTGVAAGATTLNATSGAAAGSAALTISSAVGSITATPNPLTVTMGTNGALTVKDNNNVDRTNAATYDSDNPGVVYFDYKPVITSISPSTFTQGDTNIPVAIIGTGFTSAALGQGLSLSPGTNLTLGAVTFTSPTRIDTTLSVAGGAATGGRTATVTDTGHGNSNAFAITVNATGGAPTIPVTAGRVLQLMANAGTSTTTNGANLASWTDQSATGAVFSQGTAGRQPKFVSVSQNGLPGIQFDGVDDVLTAAGIIAGLNSASGVVVFTVAKRVSGSTDGLLLSNNDINGNGGFGVGAATALSLYYGTGMTTTALPDASNNDTATHQVTWILNPASTTAKQQIIKDGTVVAASTGAYSAGTTVAPCVGALNVPDGYAGAWIIYEIVAFDLSVNPNAITTQLASLVNYFKTKWGTL